MRSLFLLPSLALAACDPARETTKTDDTAATDTAATDTGDTGAADVCDREAKTLNLSGAQNADVQACPQDTVTLQGEVSFEAGTTFRVAPGTTVKGAPEGGGFVASSLVIQAGARLEAAGTLAAPITFTSLRASPATGDWGGLILRGNAPGEGNPGGAPDDSSGTLTYVRVHYPGATVGDSELNGIALNNVGAGTTLDHIEIYASNDDAIEFFGGTVNASHLVLLETGDDSLDWTDGFRGTVSHVYIRSSGNERGVEADNRDPSKFPVDSAPLSAPTLTNVTIDGAEKNGVHLRRGTGATIVNSIVINAAGCGIYTDLDAATISGDALAFRNNLLFGNAEGAFCAVEDTADDGDAASYATATLEADPQLQGHLPKSGSPALDPVNADGTVSDHLGAFGTEDWAASWTSFLAE